MLTLIVCLACVLIFVDHLYKRQFNRDCAELPGPLCLPIFGNIWFYFRRRPDDLLGMSQELRRHYGRTMKSWILHIPAILTSDVLYVQEILSHPVEIKKNRMYNLFDDWLGNGLLMSDGTKWLKRRRIITPTFHFSILEKFVHIFDQQAQIMVGKLSRHADGVDGFDVHDYVALATLDVICETAMGVRINAQTDEHCEYVRLLMDMTYLIVTRFVNITYRPDWSFKLFAPKLAKRTHQVTEALHNFTERIITERRTEMLEASKSKPSNTTNNDLGIKDRDALLDVLLSSTIDGRPLSNADIREEVDTFMFEGHDTTKSGIGYTLYCISRHPEVQRKLFEEVSGILGTDTQRQLDYRQLMELKYMELVIRESLHMYPPVPFIGRQIQNDCQINGTKIPKGTSILLALISMQNDPEYFPEPDRFLPERQTIDNAFVFVPFSAGPRNCIGQRFAMLEMKAFVARILQSYELLPLGDAVQPTVTVILKSKTGWQMGFRHRH